MNIFIFYSHLLFFIIPQEEKNMWLAGCYYNTVFTHDNKIVPMFNVIVDISLTWWDDV